MKIVSFGPESYFGTRKIYNFMKKLYKNDPKWVPPLKMELLGNPILGAKGLLRKNHPFHEHAEVRYFIALNHKQKIQGTIAAIVNHSHNEYHNEKTGFFGFFETIEDYRVAEELLNAAKDWLKSQGMTIMRGPANFSSNDTWGLLISGFEHIPYMGTTYNKSYYKDFLERYGFEKSMDIIAELMPVNLKDEEEKQRVGRLARIAEKIKERYQIKIENFDVKNPERHLNAIYEIYHEAWKDNWGFVPISQKEFAILADNLKMAADPELIKIAYIEEKPVAFIGTLPDINEVLVRYKKMPEIFKILKILYYLKKKKFTRGRLLLFGIKEQYRKMGLDGVLFLEEFKAGQKEGQNYKDCEISWLLETNHLVIRAAESMNAHEYKRWRIFDLKIN